MFTYTPGDSKLVIDTDDPNKVDRYELLVTAKYVGSAYTVAGQLSLPIDIISDSPEY